MKIAIQEIVKLYEFCDLNIILTNSVGKIIFSNVPACHLLKYQASELIGQNIAIVINNPLNNHQGEWAAIYQKSKDFQYVDANCKDGSQVNLEIYAHEVNSLSGSYYFWVLAKHLQKLDYSLLDVCLSITTLEAFIINFNVQEHSYKEHIKFLLNYLLDTTSAEICGLWSISPDDNLYDKPPTLLSYLGCGLDLLKPEELTRCLHESQLFEVISNTLSLVTDSEKCIIQNENYCRLICAASNLAIDINNCVFVPIIYEGVLVGIYTLVNRNGGFSHEQVMALGIVNKIIGKVLLQYSGLGGDYTLLDKPTKVYDCQAYLTKFNHTLQQNHKEKISFVCLVNIINLKRINTFYSVALADKLLASLAKRLSSLVGHTNVYRVGGDEFIIFSEDLDFYTLVALLKTVGQHLDVEGERINVQLRSGVINNAKYGFDAKTTLSNLLLLLEHMRLTSSHFMEYDEAIPFLNKNSFENIDFLNKVLVKNNLELYLQPVVDLERQIIGFEVLSRLRIDGNLFMPAVFIDAIHRNGLAGRFNLLVLNKTLDMLSSDFWQAHLKLKEYRIAINISPTSDDVLNHCQELLDIIDRRAVNLWSSYLEVEITEESFTKNETQDKQVFYKIAQLLHANNVSIAIDDFGIKNSSLQRLVDCEFDTLKIDKSFVDRISFDGARGKGAVGLVRTLVALASETSMGIIAEGVETEDQFQKLISMGCSKFQGYLFYRPMPQNDLIKILTKY